MAGNAVSLACGFVSAIATARGLSTSDRGLLVAATLWVTTASWLALLGLQEAIVFHAEGSAKRAEAGRRASRYAARRQSITTVLLLIPVIALISRDSRFTLAATLYASLAIVPLNVVSQRALAVARSAQLFLRWNLVRVVPALVYAMIVAALALTERLTVSAGIWGFIGGSSIGAALALWQAREAERLDPLSLSDLSSADGLALRRYGRKVTVADIPYITNQRLDQLLLAALLPVANISIYSAAVSLTTVHSMLAATIDQVLFVRLMSRVQRSRRAALKSLIATIGCTLALALIIIPLVPAILRTVYGDAYVAATPAARVLLVAAIFLVAGAPLTAFAKAVNQVGSVILAQAIGAGLTIAMLPAAIHYHGIVGAAAVSALAYSSVVAVLCWRLFVRGQNEALLVAER